jgi:membrane protease YdiL (CAAX protease family)
MLKSASAERHPFLSFLLLLLLMMGGALVFTVIASVVVVTVYGLNALLAMSAGGVSSIEVLRILQIFTSTGMFIVPALFFAKLERKDWLSYLKIKSFPAILTVLAILIMLAISPILEWSAELNKSMKLPDFLRDLEAWMLLKEQEMAIMTKQLLRMDTLNVLLINILMLAIIPAIGEELIFRGCLQKLFLIWAGNKHVAIWLTAVIFSAIHVQFYGFIPRMLLGALFGYLLVWSDTIWIPIMTHFINNAAAVLTAYVYQQKGISLEKLDQPDPSPFYVYLISFLAGAALLWAFYTASQKYSVSLSNRTDGSRMD